MESSLGKFIQQRLDDLGKIQADLMRCTGLSRNYISYLTKDKAPTSSKTSYLPPPDVVKSLAQCLECSAAEILTAMNYLPAAELGDVEEKRLVERFRRMPDNIREVYALIGQTLDRKYSGKSGVTSPNALPDSDDRKPTHEVTSALTLQPQGENGEENGEGNGDLERIQNK